MEIYTDGSSLGNNSKLNTPGGWAFVVIQDETEIFRKFKGCLKATNNEMEMQAMIEAMTYLKNNTIETCTIYTDSNYVKQGMTVWSKKWIKNGYMSASGKPVKNKDRWTQLLDLKNNLPNVNIQWVKAHNINKWNNRADELARTSAEGMKRT